MERGRVENLRRRKRRRRRKRKYTIRMNKSRKMEEVREVKADS